MNWVQGERDERQDQAGGGSPGDPAQSLLRRLADGRFPDPDSLWRQVTAPGGTRISQLLLQPPVDDEAAYWAWLFAVIRKWLRQGKRIPDEFWEILLEGVVFSIQTGADFILVDPRQVCLRQVPCRVWNRFMKRPVTWLPFSVQWLRCLSRGRRMRWHAGMKRRLRLLHVTLSDGIPEATVAGGSLVLTFSDCLPLVRQCQGGREAPRRMAGGRWLRVARALAARAGQAKEGEAAGRAGDVCLSEVYWGGYGPKARSCFATLMEQQAAELREVRQLAEAVSRERGRVVLSCHNAGLAAMGGWAFESVWDQVENPALRHRFQARVAERARELERAFSQGGGAQRLWQHWRRRLVVPKAAHILWEQRMNLALWGADAGAQGARTRRWIARLEALVGVREGGCDALTWSGPLHPAQHHSPPDFLHWYECRRSLWAWGLAILVAVMEEGEEQLRRGNVSSLVVPWIDKFFISSKREEDIDYLAAVVDWITSRNLDPLFLFWEDTAHRRDPSFALALRRLGRSDWLGLGVLGDGSTRRRDALAVISKAASAVRLFALRPKSDDHFPVSLEQILREPDGNFRQGYDSSWKDNLFCIYAGTQVAPLLSIQADAEAIPTWVAVRGRKMALGSYLRSWLRRRVLGSGGREPAAGVSRAFWQWCNLG